MIRQTFFHKKSSTVTCCRDGREERSEDVGSRRSSSLPQLPISSSTGCSMDEVLQLVRQLYIHMEHGQADQFLSKKITNKLVTQIQVQMPLNHPTS